MSRDKRYQKLLNAKRWKEVKAFVRQRANGLCERCRREGIEAGILPDGYITPGVDCHHKIPVESANPDIPGEMERLAYDVNNIELLCVPCHIKTHQEMHSHDADTIKERKALKRRQFLLENDPNYKPQNDNDNGKNV